MEQPVCPVCDSTDCITQGQHARWSIPLLLCRDCSHTFASDSCHDAEPDDFSTNQARAEFYASLLEPLDFESMADIGTPRDCYFLSLQHRRRNGVRYAAVDPYEKEYPEFVEHHRSLSNIDVDLCTAFHVLEHVLDVKSFRDELVRSCRWFVVEVPLCATRNQVTVSSAEPHVHFFTENSFRRLFDGVQCVLSVRHGRDMADGRLVLVAHRLPFAVDYPTVGLAPKGHSGDFKKRRGFRGRTLSS